MVCLTLYSRANSKYKPLGVRGNLTEGLLRYDFGGLIFGGAYTWRALFSEFYGIHMKAAKHRLLVYATNLLAFETVSLKRNETAWNVTMISAFEFYFILTRFLPQNSHSFLILCASTAILYNCNIKRK